MRRYGHAHFSMNVQGAIQVWSGFQGRRMNGEASGIHIVLRFRLQLSIKPQLE